MDKGEREKGGAPGHTGHLITKLKTDWMLFLTPNQQCQSAGGNHPKYSNLTTIIITLTYHPAVQSRRQEQSCPVPGS